jgi:hypothetical protein
MASILVKNSIFKWLAPLSLAISLSLGCPVLAAQSLETPVELSGPVEECHFLMTVLGGAYSVHEGVPVKNHHTPDEEVRNLGRGEGGNVIRIIPKDGPIKVIKTYNSRFQAAQDVTALETLREALSLVSESSAKYKIIKVLKYEDGRTVEFENIEGQTVFDLLNYTNNEAHALLLQRYNDFLETLSIGLNRLNHNVVSVPHFFNKIRIGPHKLFQAVHATYSIEGREGLVGLYVHAENVILTPDGKMVVIDPY